MKVALSFELDFCFWILFDWHFVHLAPMPALACMVHFLLPFGISLFVVGYGPASILLISKYGFAARQWAATTNPGTKLRTGQFNGKNPSVGLVDPRDSEADQCTSSAFIFRDGYVLE